MTIPHPPHLILLPVPRFHLLGFLLAFAGLHIPAVAESPLWSWQVRPSVQANGYAFRALGCDAPGSVFVVSITGRNTTNWHTTKLAAATGQVLWERELDGIDRDDDEPHCLLVDDNRDLYVSGAADNDVTGTDACTVKYDGATGETLWQHSFHGGGTETGLAMCRGPAGKIYVLANSYDPFSGGSDFRGVWLLKYDGVTGGLLWSVRTGCGYQSNTFNKLSIITDAGGDAVVAGPFYGGAYFSPGCVERYSSSGGERIWSRTLMTSSTYDYPNALAVTPSGDVQAAGHWTPLPGGISQIPRLYVARLSGTDGTILWERRIESRYQSEALAVSVDISGDAIVSGSMADPAAQTWGISMGNGFFVGRYSSAGGLTVWQQTDPQPGAARAVLTDRQGNGWAGGFTYGNAGAEFRLIQFQTADGVLCRDLTHPFPAAGVLPELVTIQPDGSSCVATHSIEGNYYVPLIAKFGPITNFELWLKRHFGPVLETKDRSPLADPDGDGICNLLEWSCGLDPLVSGPMPGIVTIANGDIIFVYPRAKGSVQDGTLFIPEWSETMRDGEWHRSGFGVDVIEDAGDTETIHVPLLPVAGIRSFFRLRVVRRE